MKKKCNFHKKLFPFKGFYCKKSFQNPLVLCSKPFGKLKKFPYKGLFPFDGFPFNDFVLYLLIYFLKNGITFDTFMQGAYLLKPVHK